MTIDVKALFHCTVTQVWAAADLPSCGDRTVVHNQFNDTVVLDADSTPPATQNYAVKLTGNQSLDLTSLTPDLGAVINATGLKVQMVKLNNLDAANAVTIADGAPDPYSLNGTASIVIPGGGKAQLYYHDKLADVAAGAKDIDITATGDYELMIVLG